MSKTSRQAVSLLLTVVLCLGFLSAMPVVRVEAANDVLRGMEALEAAGIDTSAEGILPLKDVFADHFLVGTTLGTDAHKLYHYNAMTPENNTKPDIIWNGSSSADGTPTTTSPNFSYATSIANANNAGVYTIGHALAWHNQSRNWPARSSDRPSWNASTGVFTPITHYWDNATAREQLERYIKTIAGHFSSEYQGEQLAYQLDAWDVVNEMMRDNPEHPEDWRNALRRGDMPMMRPGNWYGAYENGGNGWDYAYDAFVWARTYAPDATLNINDFNDEELPNKAIAIAEMVKELNARYAEEYPDDPRMLIEMIGIQGHYNTRLNLDNLEKVIQIYIETGCQIEITELDVSIPDTPSFTPSAAQLREQAEFYARLFRLLTKYSDYIHRVSWWGAADNANWRSSFHPMLFTNTSGNNNKGTPKEAYWATIYPELYLGIPKEPPVLTAFDFDGESFDVGVIPEYDVNVPAGVSSIDFSADNLVYDGGDDVNVKVTLNPASGAVSPGKPCVATVELTWKDSPQNRDNTTSYQISFGHMSAEWVRDWNYPDTGYRSAVNVRFSDGETALTLQQEFLTRDGEVELRNSETFEPLPRHGKGTLAVATDSMLDDEQLAALQLKRSVLDGDEAPFVPVEVADLGVKDTGWRLAREIVPGNSYIIVSSNSGLALTHEGRSSVAPGDGITAAAQGYFGTPVNVEGETIVSTELVEGSPTTVIQDHLRFWFKPLGHPNPGEYTQRNGYVGFGLQSLVHGGLIQPYFIWRVAGNGDTLRINSETHISDANLDRGTWFHTPIDLDTGETTLFLYTPGETDAYYGLASNSNGFVAERIADIDNPGDVFRVKLYEYAAGAAADAESEIRLDTDAHNVQAGDFIPVTVAFKQEQESNAVVLNFRFDAEKFRYNGYSTDKVENVSLVDYQSGEGWARVTLMIQDYKALDLGYLGLVAKEDAPLVRGRETVQVTAEYVLRDEAGGKSTADTATSVSFTTIGDGEGGPGLPYDTNDDGVVDILDLSNMIDWFGYNRSNQSDWDDWYTYFDYNNNGEIDIQDIVHVARLI